MKSDAPPPQVSESPETDLPSSESMAPRGLLQRYLWGGDQGAWARMRSGRRHEFNRPVLLHCHHIGTLRGLTLNISRGGVALVILPQQTEAPIELEAEEEISLTGLVEESLASRVIARSGDFLRLGFIGTGRSTQQVGRLIDELEQAENLRQKADAADSPKPMRVRIPAMIALAVLVIGGCVIGWTRLQVPAPARQRLADVVTDRANAHDRPHLLERAAPTAVVLGTSNGANLPIAMPDIPATLYRLPAGSSFSATLAEGVRFDGISPILAAVDNDLHDPGEASRILVPKGTRLAGRLATGSEGPDSRRRIVWTSVVLPGDRTLRFVQIGDSSETDAAPLVTLGFTGNHVNVLVQQPLALPSYTPTER